MATLQTRFGTVEFEEADVVTLAEGLIGFPQLQRFVVLNHKPESPFRWLQSVDEGSVAFLVCEPWEFVPDYAPLISDEDCQEIAIEAETPRMTFTTANIPHGRPQELTLNLAGPIVINADTRLGKQLVIEDEAYTIKHRVFQPTESRVAA